MLHQLVELQHIEYTVDIDQLYVLQQFQHLQVRHKLSCYSVKKILHQLLDRVHLEYNPLLQALYVGQP